MKRINQKISYLIEIFICFFDIFHIPDRKNIEENSLLIIKLDAIGDYILFRNFFKNIRESTQYKNYRIILLGNTLWKDLAEEYDRDNIDQFIWISPAQLRFNILYRYDFLKKIISRGYEIIFSPVFSRQHFIDRLIAKIPAKMKVGINGDSRNTFPFLNKINNKIFDSLLTINQSVYFEFYRNKLIIERFVGSAINGELNLKVRNTSRFNSPYIVVFPDAAANYRRWSNKYFIELINFIIRKYDYTIILTGMNTAASEEIRDKVCDKNRINNLTGKTSLVQLTEIISNASLLIANDTGTVHIGAALKITTICISNGNHYGRFVPYPKELFTGVYTIFPKEIFSQHRTFEQNVSKFKEGSNLNIDSISSAQVIQIIENKKFLK